MTYVVIGLLCAILGAILGALLELGATLRQILRCINRAQKPAGFIATWEERKYEYEVK